MSQKKIQAAKRRADKLLSRSQRDKAFIAVEFFSDQTLAERWEVCRDTVWRWSREGQIPAPIKLANNTTRWRRLEIEAWEAE